MDPEGRNRPIKAEVLVSLSTPMVIASFNARGLIDTTIPPREETVNANFNRKALPRVMKTLRRKRPDPAATGCCFYWDSVSVHTNSKVRERFAANSGQVIQHAP